MNLTRTAAATAVAAALAACSSETSDVMGRPDAGAPQDTGTPQDTGAAPDTGVPADTGAPQDSGAAPDASPSADAGEACPAAPPVETLTTNEIRADTTWDCRRTWVLPDQPLFVVAPATLTIGPGTVVTGTTGSSLIVARGARLDARGTARAPVVFTSARPVGMRQRGDWGGVVLLGRASINRSGTGTGAGENQIEGLDAMDARGRYGGGAAPDDDHDCGALRYVRIEFAGHVLARDNELNGLTVGACGRRTVLDHVQVHRGEDDGIELFGGTVDLRHAVVTYADDDGLDWDYGWRGRGQHLVVAQSLSTESDPTGVEADNDRDNNAAAPRSNPLLYNVTLVGPEGADTMRAMVLRRGTAFRVHNALVLGWGAGAIDVRDLSTATAEALGATVANSLFFDNGAGGAAHFPAAAMDFDEGLFFRAAARANRFDLDPRLQAPYAAGGPSFVPAADSPAATGAATPPADGFFDATATYVGAVPPGAATTWLDGWTAFPAN